MSGHSVIYDPWNLGGGSALPAWRFRCDLFGESREVVGDYPEAPPVCAIGHCMVEVRP